MYTVVTETSEAPIVETFLFRQNAEAMYVVRCQKFEMVSLFDPNGNLINISYVEDWEVVNMLALITKVSSDYYYKFKNINTVEDILSIYPRIIIEKNTYTRDIVEFWEGFKPEDIPNLEKAEINIIIYDDYIE